VITTGRGISRKNYKNYDKQEKRTTGRRISKKNYRKGDKQEELRERR
jgi:hypothetical protein